VGFRAELTVPFTKQSSIQVQLLGELRQIRPRYGVLLLAWTVVCEGKDEESFIGGRKGIWLEGRKGISQT